jgi:CheY-like chemotaxis protein
MEHHEPKPRLIAILNSNDDLLRLIRETLHDEGYLTMQHHIADLRDGKTDITRLFEDRNPPVIIYDLAPPFTLNWQFFQILSSHRAVKGRHVILTTSNAAALKKISGVDALQVVGSNDDLSALVTAVNDEFRRLKEGPPPLPGSRLRKVGQTV